MNQQDYCLNCSHCFQDYHLLLYISHLYATILIKLIYDQTYKLFLGELESTQYNSVLAITDVIQGSCSGQLKQKLGLDSLQCRNWFRKLCKFYKILKNKQPRYLFSVFQLIPELTKPIIAIIFLTYKGDFLDVIFFPSSLAESNKLNREMRKYDNVKTFEKGFLKFPRPSNIVFPILITHMV